MSKFGGFGGGGMDMGKLMKQAQKMQKDMAKAQEELKTKVVEGTSGGGMIKISMNGDYEIIEVKIEKDVVDPDDVEMLQDLVAAALNDAVNKVKDTSNSEMSKLTGGMKIPGLF
ncbi:MAG: YbaB/EbfC family nucleoid-associated protein [Candidatus Muirbacterium halophilum]|nr:YbaB/EbfC family nucleoid-associated protein [Candidatus Muirbacterium halophilum]MCK9477222.1 YbaB/EbfC family nucleoid-associated protein [Candidatus Muirbacterium halophilum]